MCVCIDSRTEKKEIVLSTTLYPKIILVKKKNHKETLSSVLQAVF